MQKTEVRQYKCIYLYINVYVYIFISIAYACSQFIISTIIPILQMRWLSGMESICQCRRHRRCRRPMFDLWVGTIPWRRKQQPRPVFLPGESHGQRSL